jgi:hypothetical protein
MWPGFIWLRIVTGWGGGEVLWSTVINIRVALCMGNLPKNYLLLCKDSTQLRYLFGIVVVFTLKTNFGVRMKPIQVFSPASKNSNIQEIEYTTFLS